MLNLLFKKFLFCSARRFVDGFVESSLSSCEIKNPREKKLISFLVGKLFWGERRTLCRVFFRCGDRFARGRLILVPIHATPSPANLIVVVRFSELLA
jgi:hypothetical protein